MHKVLNTDIVEAVISVPAYFNESQRRATKQAGEIAGLKIERLINEPTAAAIFHSSADLARTKTVLVFDLGGGTLDVTILNQYQSVIEIIATAGNHRLGGEDLTDAIVAYFLKEHGLSQSVVDRTELAKLRHHSEYIKRSLLHKDSVNTYASIEGVSRLLVLTADKLTSIFESHLHQMLLVLKQAIRDAGRFIKVNIGESRTIFYWVNCLLQSRRNLLESKQLMFGFLMTSMAC